MSESQVDVVIDDEDDEGSIEKQIREAGQQVLQKQQDLIAAQAHADRARQAEAEACEAWKAKRYGTRPCLHALHSPSQNLHVSMGAMYSTGRLAYCWLWIGQPLSRCCMLICSCYKDDEQLNMQLLALDLTEHHRNGPLCHIQS